MSGLQPPRHISTLPFASFSSPPSHVRLSSETHRESGRAGPAALGHTRGLPLSRVCATGVGWPSTDALQALTREGKNAIAKPSSRQLLHLAV